MGGDNDTVKYFDVSPYIILNLDMLNILLHKYQINVTLSLLE